MYTWSVQRVWIQLLFASARVRKACVSSFKTTSSHNLLDHMHIQIPLETRPNNSLAHRVTAAVIAPKKPHSSDNGSCSMSRFVPSARDNQQTSEVLNKCSLPCHLLTKPHRCTPHPISLHDGISHQVYKLQSEHVSWIKMELHYINLSEVNL